MKIILNKGLHECIRQIARNFWGNNGNADLKERSRYAKPMERILGRRGISFNSTDEPARKCGRGGGKLLITSSKSSSVPE